MHILTNTYPWTVFKNSRERRVHTEILSLGKQFEDMTFSMVESIPAMFVGNGLFITQAVFDRLLRRLSFFQHMQSLLVSPPYWYFLSKRVNYISTRFIRAKKADLLFAHEYFPINLSQKVLPIVYDTRIPTDECVLSYVSPYGGNLNVREHEMRMKRFCSERSTLVTVTSPGDKKRFCEKLPDLAHKVRQVPWYVPELECISYNSVLAKHEESGPLRILFVGNDAKRKGLPELLRSLEFLSSQERSRIEITLVTNFRDGVIATDRLDVSVLSDIPFLQVQKLMQESHLFLFPTKGDTYGLVMMEAMAAGCAIIGPKREPQDWFLAMGEAGLLVEPTQPETIAAALKTLIHNPVLRKKLALKAYQRFRSVFYHPVVGQRLREVFCEALEKRKSASRGFE